MEYISVRDASICCSSGMNKRPSVARRKRPRTSSSRVRCRRSSSSGLLSLLLLLALPPVSRATFEYCTYSLNSADVDKNGFVNAQEYADLLYDWTLGWMDYINDAPSVPASVTAVYALNSPNPADGLDISSNTLELCQELESALLQAYGKTLNAKRCARLFILESNPATRRADRTQFAAFVSAYSEGSLNVTSFDSLAPILQTIFTVYETDDEVPWARFDQTTKDALCSETLLAISAVEVGSDLDAGIGIGGTLAPLPEETKFCIDAAKARATEFGNAELIGKIAYSFWVSDLTNGGLDPNFQQLPIEVQDLFDQLKSGSGRITVPGLALDPIPSEDLQRLADMCDQILDTVQPYVRQPTAPPTLPPTLAPTPSPTAPTTAGTMTPQTLVPSYPPVSSAFLARCRTALVVGDLSRNDELVDSEYVRFINRMISTSYTNFNQLNPIFQEDFAELAGDKGFIDVSGTKPGSTPTAEQQEYLGYVCSRTSQAIDEVNNSSPTPTRPPSESTLAPTLGGPPEDVSVDFLNDCRTALVIGDINRNDQLERTEYIRFIYKLTGDFEFLGKTLEEIDPAFQTSFETLSNGNDYIDVSGTKPSDTPTEEEQENMRQVCLSTSRAIYFYVNGGSEPAPNPAVPTASPAPNPTDFVLNDADYNQCKASLALSDVNRDDWLEPDEFVRFLNQYFDNAFVSFAFEDLDESFQLSYDAARGVRVFVDIQGVRSTSPSSVEDESITAVCTEFVGAINRYADPGSDTITECLDVIAQVNKDGANVLSAQEYLVLIDALSDRLWPDSRSLDDLPFVVADNYEWLKLGNDEIDISGLGDPAATEAQKEAYDSLCERTVRVIAFAKVVADEEPDDLLAYCTIPLSNADLNGDAMLNDAEFLEFIKLLSGNAWAGQSLSTVPSPLRELFILAADQESATIPIPGSRPGDTATSSELDDLDNFCWDAEDAIVSAREVMFQFPRCKAAMVAADVDSNGRLSQAEYVVFLYDLLGEDPDGVSFEDLDRVAQVSYNLLRIRGDTDLSVAGAGSGSNVTEQEEDRLRWICANTETVLDELDTSDSDSEPTSTVYNSFIVSNKVGLKAADLQTGLEREGLDVAYSVFVEELVQSEDTSRLRGRMLQNVDLREDSARIYQLDDTACPSSASGLTCQVAYARFVLFTEDQAVRLAYEELSQEAIERGDLQAVLIRVDARNDLTIVGASRPLVPGENQGASPPPTTFTTPVIIGIAVAGGVGLIGICLALYCWYDRRRIRAAVKPSTSSVYGQEKDTSDDGSNENDYEPVFIPKTVLESIGSSSVKQESTPRSGPRKAYDQSSIDGEAYAENDDYYDEPVEEEYGYDQPDSYEEDELVEDEYGDYEEPVYGAQTQGYDDGYDDGYNYDDEPAQDPEYYDEEQYEEPYEEEYEEEEEDGVIISRKVGYHEPDEFDELAAASVHSHQQFEGDPAGSYFEEEILPPEQHSPTGNEWDEHQLVSPIKAASIAESTQDSYEDVSAESSDLEEEVIEEEVVNEYEVEPEKVEVESIISEESSEMEEEIVEDDEEIIEEEIVETDADESVVEEVVSESSMSSETSEGEDNGDEVSSGVTSLSEESAKKRDDSAGSLHRSYREQIETLVQEVAPDEVGNIDDMMEQFDGREEELIETLQNMADTSAAEANGEDVSAVESAAETRETETESKSAEAAAKEEESSEADSSSEDDEPETKAAPAKEAPKDEESESSSSSSEEEEANEKKEKSTVSKPSASKEESESGSDESESEAASESKEESSEEEEESEESEASEEEEESDEEEESSEEASESEDASESGSEESEEEEEESEEESSDEEEESESEEEEEESDDESEEESEESEEDSEEDDEEEESEASGSEEEESEESESSEEPAKPPPPAKKAPPPKKKPVDSDNDDSSSYESDSS